MSINARRNELHRKLYGQLETDHAAVGRPRYISTHVAHHVPKLQVLQHLTQLFIDVVNVWPPSVLDAKSPSALRTAVVLGIHVVILSGRLEPTVDALVINLGIWVLAEYLKEHRVLRLENLKQLVACRECRQLVHLPHEHIVVIILEQTSDVE